MSPRAADLLFRFVRGMAVLAGLLALSFGVIMLASLLALTQVAFGHEAQPDGWSYPLECCSGYDCARIPDAAARQVAGGWEVRLAPGDHQFVTAATGPVVLFFESDRVRPSPDGATHACLRADLTPLCLFVLPGVG